MIRARRSLHGLVVMMLLCAPRAFAQEAPVAQKPEEPTQRGTGLPPQVSWKFNLDATWGSFGFANSLYQNPKEDVPENLSQQWFEGSVKPALAGVFRLANSSEFYGKLSAVGERTYGAAPELVGPDISSFQAEDLAIGWRSGTLLGLGENAVDVSVGRLPYRIGHNLLLGDGGAEGGSRGGYWTNMRKAFQFGALGRVHSGHHTAEVFYLDKDELPEHDTGTRLWGANYELTPKEGSTFGVSYLRFFADPEQSPDRDGLNVFNLRAYTAPIPAAPDVSFEAEYASERNGDLLNSNAWTLQGGYKLSGITWKPTISYRYAFFQGDDPATTRNEAFDPLLPGFYDWGSWWQGEIMGEYIVANSNLKSHLVRVHATPTASVSGGVMFYKFFLHHPSTLGENVTASDIAFETDFYTDWKINANFTASFVMAFANPERAAEQAFNRTKTFSYGMVFLAYSY